MLFVTYLLTYLLIEIDIYMNYNMSFNVWNAFILLMVKIILQYIWKNLNQRVWKRKKLRQNNKYSHVPLENHSVNLYTLHGRTCKQQKKKPDAKSLGKYYSIFLCFARVAVVVVRYINMKNHIKRMTKMKIYKVRALFDLSVSTRFMFYTFLN